MAEVQAPQSVTAGLMTLAQFAADIRKGVRTVRRYVDRGLPVVRIGSTPYINPLTARAWFEDGCPPPSSAAPRRACLRRNSKRGGAIPGPRERER